MSSQGEWEVACGFSELEVSLAKSSEMHSRAQISRRQNSLKPESQVRDWL